MVAAVLDSNSRAATRAFRRMEAVNDALQRRGESSGLIRLLDDQERFVRHYSAQIVPDRDRAVIEENAKLWFDAIAGDAAMTLRAVDQGNYNKRN
jgi:hypothetical protein